MPVGGAFDRRAADDSDLAFVGAPVDRYLQQSDSSRSALPHRFEQKPALADVEHPHRRLHHEQTFGIKTA